MIDSRDDVCLLFFASSDNKFVFERLSLLRTEPDLVNEFSESCTALHASGGQKGSLTHCTADANLEGNKGQAITWPKRSKNEIKRRLQDTKLKRSRAW